MPLVARRGVTVGVRRGERVDTSVRAPGEVEGPIERGERLGEVTVSLDGREVGTVPVVAARAADEASFLEQARGRYAGVAIPIAIGAGVILIGLVVIRRARGRRLRSSEERMRSYEERMQRRERQTVPEREAERP